MPEDSQILGSNCTFREIRYFCKKSGIRKDGQNLFEMGVRGEAIGLSVALFFFILIGLGANGVCAGHDEYVWEQVPLYSAQYKPRHINAGFQMTHALAYAPSNPSFVYLCTDTSRVWRSIDGGEGWQQASDGMLSNGCRSLLVDPVNPYRIVAAGFLGVDEKKGRRRKFKHQGLYLTEDGGESWRFVQKANFFRQVSKSPLLAYDSSSVKNGRTMVWYAGSYDEGLYKSSDGGRTWRLVDRGLSAICAIEEIPDKPGELIIATESGLHLYDKQQATQIGEGLPENACAIAIHPAEPGTMLAAAGNKGVYRSVDGGKSFRASNAGMPLFTPNIASLAVSRNPPYIVYAKSHKSNQRLPLFSRDGGLNWKLGKYAESIGARDSKRHFWFSSALAPHPVHAEQALVVSSGDGKVFRTDDGGKSWGMFGTGYTGARVMEMLFDEQYIILALTDFGLWVKNRNEAYFREVKLPRYKGASSTHLIGKLLKGMIATVGTWHDQSIAVQSSEGEWRLIPELHGHFRNLSIHPENPAIVYIDNFRSLDNGKTWVRLPHAISAISRSPMGRIYALEGLKDDRATVVLYSDDNGDSWASYAPPVPLAKKQINQLVPDLHSKSRLYLASNNGVWVFDGSAWGRRADKEGLSQDAFGFVYVSTLVVDPNRPGRLMAGRAAPGMGVSNGIFQSEDGGDTWSNISGNLGETLYVWSMYIDPIKYVLYAGTDRGLVKHILDP